MCIRAVNKYTKRVAKWQCFWKVYIYQNFNTHTHSRTVYINSEAMSKVSFWEMSWTQSQGPVALLTTHSASLTAPCHFHLGGLPSWSLPCLSETLQAPNVSDPIFHLHTVAKSALLPTVCPPVSGSTTWSPHPPTSTPPWSSFLKTCQLWRAVGFSAAYAPASSCPALIAVPHLSWGPVPFTCVAIIVLPVSCPHLPAPAPLATGPPPAPRCPQNQIETCQLENQTPF